ncbi:nuclease-related domain-containing protein [Sporosarcina sp. G11-34]|uniref:nuclease-related domain-containing protein n=1 Tax=Sporosarcina sp. G11-34 TaxID=2849605 RepID=UPI0022A97D91|nr:nuclease-related domain-containing protein [Sporosarcina sp. G11-34]MCZ2258674.1 NERD domain-containing protein [Sporosarcina sp. G11-34]
MIYKQRTIPGKLQGLKALEKRLSTNHQELKSIQREIYNRRAGFGGEQHFDKKMTEFQPLYPHAILHGICLKQNGIFFEMDSILITPAFIIIFEAKNIGEKLILSSNPTQFIKVSSDGTRKGLTSPVAELERKAFHLIEWLLERKIKIPIRKVVAFAYSNELTVTDIKGTKIAFAYEIPAYLRTLTVDTPILTKIKIRNLANEMVRYHEEYNPFPILSTMKITSAEIETGVICPNCSRIGMQWLDQKWTCPPCKYTGKTEHQDAIKDWFMLINSKMTNRQFRYFTKMQDRNIATRLLAKSSLEMRGERRNSYYIMKDEKTLRDI